MPASSHLITQTIRQPNNLNLIQYSRNFSVYPYSQISYKVKLRNSKNCFKFILKQLRKCKVLINEYL